MHDTWSGLLREWWDVIAVVTLTALVAPVTRWLDVPWWGVVLVFGLGLGLTTRAVRWLRSERAPDL